MDDKKIITSLLNKNFIVRAGASSFIILDLNDDKTFSETEFIERIFKKIVGDYVTSNGKSSIDIFNVWLETNKRQITKDLRNHIKKIDLSLGSEKLSKDLLEKFGDNKKYSNSFISNYFNDFYFNKELLPALKKYVKDFKEVEHSYNSNLFFDRVELRLRKESNTQYDLASKFLNEWYSDNVLKEKVEDLLGQLVITLGRSDWRVTWVGHGELTDIKFREQFKKENSYQLAYAKGMYEEWYEKTVARKSESLMARAEGKI